MDPSFKNDVTWIFNKLPTAKQVNSILPVKIIRLPNRLIPFYLLRLSDYQAGYFHFTGQDYQDSGFDV